MHSGIKIAGHRSMSIKEEIVDFNKPEIVYIPLVNYSNLDCECLVKVGDEVLKGSIIGRRNDNIELPIHASVSGKVIGIEEHLYLNGEKVKCVVIQNDYREKQEETKGAKEKISSHSKEDFIKLLKDCAVTGMGGSDFPTYIKYKDVILNTLIVNVVECEPYITADYMLSKLKIEEILETVDAIMEINNIKRSIIAVREGNDIGERFSEYLGTYPNISLVYVKSLYPMGWEKELIKETLNVEYEKFPGEKGIVVNNVSTIYAIYKALKHHKPISRRIITVTGDMIKQPQNIIVKIGTPMSKVIEKIGGYKKGSNIKFVAGGPMMGNCMPSDDLIVTKNLNCVLVTDDLTTLEEITCIRCGRCVNVCPAKIAPVLIRDHVGDFESLKELYPEKCIECGLCSYVCPSKINVREYVREAKKEIRRH